MNLRNRAFLAAVLTCALVVGVPLGAVAAAGGFSAGQTYPTHNAYWDNQSVQWVRMPAPYNGGQPVWCVVVDTSNSGGTAISCDWNGNGATTNNSVGGP